MSDKLIENLSLINRIWVSYKTIGQKAFSIRTNILIGDVKKQLILGRPYNGIDEMLWGVIKDEYENDIGESEIYVKGISIRLTDIVTHSNTERTRSISDIVFYGSRSASLRIFGDIDEFEVPCINCEIII